MMMSRYAGVDDAPQSLPNGVVSPQGAGRRAYKVALAAGVLAGVVTYALTSRTGLSVLVGGISGGFSGLAYRGRESRSLRASIMGFARLANHLPPSVAAANCVEAAKRSAQERGLDLATLPQVPPVVCTTENGKSVCRSADGVAQAIDCLPELGTPFHAFAIAVERTLARANLDRAGNGPLPANPVQPIDQGPIDGRWAGGQRGGTGYEQDRIRAEMIGEPMALVFGNRDGRQ